MSAVLRALVPHDVDRRGIGVLSFGHLAADLTQGAVPPLLPFLIHDRGYSYAAAGSLLLFSSLGSSVIQPLLGVYADRIRATWMMPVGALLGALGVAVVGFTPGYLTTGAALGVASVGVAMYHPEGVRYASYVSLASRRRGTGMSLFAVGGMTGWALGPLLVTPAVLLFGLPGMALVAVVPASAAILLAANLRYVERFRPARDEVAAGVRAGDSAWGAFTLAAGAGMARTGTQFGLQAFVPLYVWKVLHSSQATGNATSTVLLVCGAFGTLLGGRIADRIGFRPLVVRSLALVVPLVAALVLVPLWGVLVLMALIGLTMEANFYPLVVVAQNALPRHVGFASGVMLGLSIGFGALTAALLGVLADHAGLTRAIEANAVLAAVALVLAYAMPRSASRSSS